MELTLGQAFSLACLIEYGAQLPIELSGHLVERKGPVPFSWYCLTELQLETVLAHMELCSP